MEMDILANVDHPSVVKLIDIFDNSDAMYLILEYMAGGELFDRIVEKEQYTELEAATTIAPIVDAIRYCHSVGIIHRDLKPENLLYQSNDEHAGLKVTDFGVGRFLDPNEMASTAVGTPSYMAPEVCSG
jgi:calcium/calmodulin-dependent protein kinase I